MHPRESGRGKRDVRQSPCVRGLQLRAGERMVVRPVHLAWLNDHDGCAIGDAPLRGLVCAEFRLVVPGEESLREITAVRLGDDLPMRVAEDVGRAEIDGARYA